MMKTARYTLYVSAFLVVLGLFLPLVTLPVYGGVYLFKVALGQSVAIVLLAVLTVALSILKWNGTAIASSAGIWFVLAYPGIKSYVKGMNRSALGDAVKVMTDPIKDFTANLFLNVVNFEPGGYAFLLGCVAIVVSAVAVKIISLRHATEQEGTPLASPPVGPSPQP